MSAAWSAGELGVRTDHKPPDGCLLAARQIGMVSFHHKLRYHYDSQDNGREDAEEYWHGHLVCDQVGNLYLDRVEMVIGDHDRLGDIVDRSLKYGRHFMLYDSSCRSPIDVLEMFLYVFLASRLAASRLST